MWNESDWYEFIVSFWATAKHSSFSFLSSKPCFNCYYLSSDALFDPDQSKTSLESALDLLENMRTTFQIPHRDIDSASTIIKEMVSVFFFFY